MTTAAPTTVGDIPDLTQLKNLLLPGMYRFSGETPVSEGAVYDMIFLRRKSEVANEAVMHMRYVGLAQLNEKNPSKVQVHDDETRPGPDQRFIWHSHTLSDGVMFALVPDTDPRRVPVKFATFVDYGTDVRPHRLAPVGASDFTTAMQKMIKICKGKREKSAAHVFNTANVYDPTVGGDGVCLAHTGHPFDLGVWANTFETQQALNASSLEAACLKIAEFKDDLGGIISINPTALLVPKALATVGLDVVSRSPHVHDLIVWNELSHKRWWFVLTDAGGLTHFLRTPFEVDMWVEMMEDMILIKSRWRNSFFCHDPRSLFASMPLD